MFPGRNAVPAVELGNQPLGAQVTFDALSKQLHSHNVSVCRMNLGDSSNLNKLADFFFKLWHFSMKC